jgi:hypothetical protein
MSAIDISIHDVYKPSPDIDERLQPVVLPCFLVFRKKFTAFQKVIAIKLEQTGSSTIIQTSNRDQNKNGLAVNAIVNGKEHKFDINNREGHSGIGFSEIQCQESNNILGAAHKEPSIGSPQIGMIEESQQIDKSIPCEPSGRYQGQEIPARSVPQGELVVEDPQEANNLKVQPMMEETIPEGIPEKGIIGVKTPEVQGRKDSSAVQTPTKLEIELQNLASELRRRTRSQQKDSRKNPYKHDYIYNHNSVLLGERIEDVEFDENYFTRPRVHKKDGACDQSSKKKRQTGAGECCICFGRPC